MDLTAPQRYLNLLKSSLLNELYLENEVRLLYIFAMQAAGRPVDHETVRNISQLQPEWVTRVRTARQEGRPWWLLKLQSGGRNKKVNLRNLCEFSHTMIGRKRLENIEHCLDSIRADGIGGDIIETGVWRGGASIFMRGYLAAYEMCDRKVWVADSFEGLPKPTYPQDEGFDFSTDQAPILTVPIEEVKDNFRRYGLLDKQVEFVKGWFKDTLPQLPVEKIALARLDGDLYESTMASLTSLYNKIVSGGYIIIDDYGDFAPCRQAVDEFREENSISAPLQIIDWAGVFWRKP